MPAALAGGAFYLYVRYRGLSFSDFFVVTNRCVALVGACNLITQQVCPCSNDCSQRMTLHMHGSGLHRTAFPPSVAVAVF